MTKFPNLFYLFFCAVLGSTGLCFLCWRLLINFGLLSFKNRVKTKIRMRYHFLCKKSKTSLEFDQTIFGVPCLRKTITKPLTLPNASCINSPNSFVVWSNYIHSQRVIKHCREWQSFFQSAWLVVTMSVNIFWVLNFNISNLLSKSLACHFCPFIGLL